jgi:hypothetical protein
MIVCDSPDRRFPRHFHLFFVIPIRSFPSFLLLLPDILRLARPRLHTLIVLQSFAMDPPILRLPSEIVLRILSHLPPTQIALLALTCRAFAQIARTDDVWRPRCLELWRKHRSVGSPPALSSSSSWSSLWRSLLGPYQHHLGTSSEQP